MALVPFQIDNLIQALGSTAAQLRGALTNDGVPGNPIAGNHNPNITGAHLARLIRHANANAALINDIVAAGAVGGVFQVVAQTPAIAAEIEAAGTCNALVVNEAALRFAVAHTDEAAVLANILAIPGAGKVTANVVDDVVNKGVNDAGIAAAIEAAGTRDNAVVNEAALRFAVAHTDEAVVLANILAIPGAGKVTANVVSEVVKKGPLAQTSEIAAAIEAAGTRDNAVVNEAALQFAVAHTDDAGVLAHIAAIPDAAKVTANVLHDIARHPNVDGAAIAAVVAAGIGDANIAAAIANQALSNAAALRFASADADAAALALLVEHGNATEQVIDDISATPICQGDSSLQKLANESKACYALENAGGAESNNLVNRLKALGWTARIGAIAELKGTHGLEPTYTPALQGMKELAAEDVPSCLQRVGAKQNTAEDFKASVRRGDAAALARGYGI